MMLDNGSIWGCDICQNVCPYTKNASYTPIEYFKNETCWDPGYIKHGIKPHLYQKGYFTLTNGKKIEFDITCSSKEFMKMWRKIKRANPKAKLIELPM